jgi:hypothetical protein
MAETRIRLDNAAARDIIERTIQTLMELGASRDTALRLLVMQCASQLGDGEARTMLQQADDVADEIFEEFLAENAERGTPRR